MPLRNVRYTVTRTPKGPVRLAFSKTTGKLREAKNLKTGKTHKNK